MKYSHYQEAIFEAINQPENDIVLAGPGCAKTTTMVKAVEFIPNNERVLLSSFGTDICKELAAKVPFNVEVRTLNSIGFKICRDNVSKITIDKFKTENIFRTLVDNGIFYKYKAIVKRIISLLKNNFLIENLEENIKEIIQYHAFEFPDDMIPYVVKTFDIGLQHTNMMDFDDQKFFPVYYNWSTEKYDKIGIDEAQDLCRLERMLLTLLRSEHTKFLFVGDEFQSIYGFKGADVNSLEYLEKEFNCRKFLLPICYRCPDAIIEEAQKINPNLEKPVPNLKGRGIVETVSKEKFYEEVKEGDAILCRVTYPLIKECLKLMPKMYIYVKGRDIGQGLIDLIKTITKGRNLEIKEFSEELISYSQREIDRLLALKREDSVSTLEDQVESLKALITKCDEVQGLLELIKEIIPENENQRSGAVCMTMHKAKGLEFQDGWILRSDLIPHKRAKTDWQLIQERNLKFVAITRFQRSVRTVLKEKGER